MKHIKVATAIMQDADTILAAQRGYGDLKGWWEFPGGKIESGETPEDTLIREIREELEVEIEINQLFQVIEYDYPSFHLTMYCFLCKIVSGQLVLKEHSNVRWLVRKQLSSVEWLPANHLVINRLRAWMKATEL